MGNHGGRNEVRAVDTIFHFGQVASVRRKRADPNRRVMSEQVPAKDEKGRFLTGNIGGGRPKGSRNKLGEAFLADMLADWEENGISVIETVCLEKPDQYLKVVASVLPKELNVRVSDLDELSDDELDRQLASLATQLARAGFVAPEGEAAQVESQSAGKVQAVH